MITQNGYSKDLSIMPEGIMLTLPVMFFEDRGMSTEQFKDLFERYMAKDDAIWNFKLTNLPKHEIAWVYLIFDKHVQYRLNFVQYERNKTKAFRDSHDGKIRHFPNLNWVIFTGPAIKPPHPWPQKGFQGFRYTTFLF
jgi:hypothetical protein